jgi:flagellar basal-body rod protein FlgB
VLHLSLFSGTISTLENALTYSSTKQKVISQNIANVDTPKYKAKDVSFKAVYDNALAQTLKTNKTNPKHLDFSSTITPSFKIHTKPVSYNESGNSVDIDQEMADLASNQIYYNAITERISGKFSSLQNVIRGGK